MCAVVSEEAEEVAFIKRPQTALYMRTRIGVIEVIHDFVAKIAIFYQNFGG